MRDLETAGPRPLSEQAYDVLLRAIVGGELPPGAQVRDKALAARFGMSRTPVREALRRLGEEGLVETVPNVASRIAPVRADRAAQAFPVIAVLHALGARLGVPALTEEDLGRMERLDARRREVLARHAVVEAIDADDAFHGVLLDRAGNDELKRSLARLMPQIRRLDVLHFSALAQARDPGDHAAILAACRRRDPDAAAGAVEANFMRLGAQVEAILDREAGCG